MRAVSLHGVRVGWHCDLDEDPVSPLVGTFPAADPGAPLDLTIEIASGTDGADTHVDAAPLFFHGLIRGYRSEDGGLRLTDGASGLRLDGDFARIRARLAPGPRDAEAPAPVMLFIALMIALRRRGLFHLHAAGLVPDRGRGLLVVGESGAGKSTAALALVRAGWRWLGDDAVLLAERDGHVVALSLPKEFHVGPRTLAAFPEVAPLAGARYRREHDKRPVDPRLVAPDRQADTMVAPGVLLFPEVSPDRATALAPIDRAEALGALLPSSALLVVPGLPRAAEHLSLLRALADGAVAFRATLGPDLLERPSLLADRLAAALAPGGAP
jgi:hypothetical protein